MDLFRYKSLLRMTLGCCWSFFCLQMVYFGINYSCESFGFDIYTNTLFSDLGEAFGYILFFFVVEHTPRKKYSLIGFITCSLLCLSFVPISIPTQCKPEDQFCY